MLRLFRWLARCPLWFLHALGGALGWITYAASPTYRRRFRQNVAQAGISAREARPAIAEAGRLVMETPFLWLRPADEPIRPALHWEGEALLVEALKQRKGIVLLTPHMGSFEVTAQACAQSFAAEHGPITVLYRPARKPWLRELEESARARPALATAPANLSGVRLMIRALRRGETVGLLPDQVPPEGMGVWAPFFGQPAYTMTLAARLVQQTGSGVVVLCCERLPRGAGYVVRVMPLPEPLPERAGGDEEAHQQAAAVAINRSMEAVIRGLPTQYLWGYHRYKSPRREAAP